MSLKRALLWCGVIGPIFFTVAYLVEGATRAGYHPMRDPVSSLALGGLHDLFSLGVFFGLPLACLVAAKRLNRERRPGWAVYSILTAGAFFVLFVLAGTGFTGDQTFAPIGGLMQRLSLTVGFAWVVAIALLECRRTSRP